MWMILVAVAATWGLLHLRKVRKTQSRESRFRKGPRAIFR
jgi:hypothetical protein